MIMLTSPSQVSHKSFCLNMLLAFPTPFPCLNNYTKKKKLWSQKKGAKHLEKRSGYKEPNNMNLNRCSMPAQMYVSKPATASVNLSAHIKQE